MSDMSSSVILRMVDDLTGPAKKAGASIRSIIKDMEKLRSLSGKSLGGARQMQTFTRHVQNAHKAAVGLNRAMARPPSAGYTRAAQNISGVTRAANQASSALRNLNNRMRNPGGGGGSSGGRGGGASAGGGARRHSGGGMFAGFAGAVSHRVGSALTHVGVFEAVDHGIRAMSEGIHEGLNQAFDKRHTMAMLKMQGESQKDIDAALAQAQSLTKALPQFTSAQHLEAIAELRPALQGGLAEAVKLAPLMQKSVAVLEAVKQGAGAKALAGVNTHGEALSLVRALEIKGVTQLGEKTMESYVDGITKAIVAFNGQIKAEDFHSAFKFSRGASNNWSESFATTVLPTLMNELKKSSKADASQTGNALSSMFAAVVQGDIAVDRASLWQKYGMLKPGSYKTTKQGVKIKKGEGVLGADLFASDPYRFMQEILLPHMAAHGVDIHNREQVVRAMGGLFGNRVARQIAVILATQQQLIEKDKQNVLKAQGLGGLDFLKNADPTVRMHVLSASLKELAGALGDVAMPGTLRGMKGIIDWAHSLTDTIRKSPYMEGLKNKFEALTAGIFGQKMGRRGLGMSKDLRGYYEAGAALSGGFTHLISSIGKSLASLEEAGVFRVSMEGLGIALDGVAGACDLARNSAEAMANAFKSAFDKGGIIDTLLKPIGLDHETREALHRREIGRFTGRPYKPEVDTGPQAPSGPVRGRNGAKVPDLGIANAWNTGTHALWRVLSGAQPAPTTVNPMGVGAFGFHGANMGSGLIAPITQAADSVRPIFAAAGASGAGALAAGFASGEGQITGQMQALMGNLAAIAGGGITIPLKLDKAGAEADLAAFKAKAGSFGGLPGRSQFSGALNDGH